MLKDVISMHEVTKINNLKPVFLSLLYQFNIQIKIKTKLSIACSLLQNYDKVTIYIRIISIMTLYVLLLRGIRLSV